VRDDALKFLSFPRGFPINREVVSFCLEFRDQFFLFRGLRIQNENSAASPHKKHAIIYGHFDRIAGIEIYPMRPDVSAIAAAGAREDLDRIDSVGFSKLGHRFMRALFVGLALVFLRNVGLSVRLDPIWDPLRGDPAFQKLCEEKQP
jgi:hypothetical protein